MGRLSLPVMRMLTGASYSAIISAVIAPVYFTACAVLTARTFSATGILNALIMIAVFAVPVASISGFFMGIVGVYLLESLSFIQTKVGFVSVSMGLGAILGSVPAVMVRLFSPLKPVERLGFLPCVLLGILCAGTWALIDVSRRPERLA